MSQQKSPHEEFIMVFVVGGLLFGIAWAVWSVYHAPLTNALRWIRVGEMWIATALTAKDYSIDIPEVGRQYLKSWREWLPHAAVSEINYPEIKAMTYVAVPPLRLLFSGLMGLMAFWVMFFGPGSHYRRRMTLETLMQEQARSFPIIKPFVKFNPCLLPYRVIGKEVPAVLPLFSEALSPEEWIAFHEVQIEGGQMNVNQAFQGLISQLGKRWQGPLKLPLHAQALYAAFALRHVRKRKDSEEMLNEFALSWTPDSGFKPSAALRAKIRAVIKNPKIGGALQKYADQHAYETTALLRCLSRAREEGGVLAPASFLWLRGTDRNLWYPMNNLGRRSYHAEAAGAMVHYTNELIAGQKIPTPRFDDVIRGFEAFLKSTSSRAIPHLNKTAKTVKFWKQKSR